MGLMKVKLPAISSFITTAAKPPPSDEIFKTLNSVYFDHHDVDNDNNNSSSNNDHDENKDDDFGGGGGGDEEDDIELIIRGAHSETRLFFEPSVAKAIAPDEGGQVVVTTFKESVAVAVESDNPYADFKKSMEEMVDQTHIKDWSSLEELLAWYLRVNSAANHAYIVAAFVDLLVRISAGEYDSDGASNANNEGCSSISSSSSVCGELAAVGIKSSTSFSSAASSFNSEDHHRHQQPPQIHGYSSPKTNLEYIGE